MEFKFQFSKIASFFLKKIVVWIILILVFSFFYSDLVKKEIKIFSILITVALLPTGILFIQYVVNDWKSALIFNRRDGLIEYRKNNVHLKYKISDLERVELVVPPGQASNSEISLYPQDSYFYYVLHFTSKDKVVITSLLLGGKKINPVNMKEIKIEERVVFFPFLKA